MTTTTFNTKEDYENLNNQLKFMFDHGLDKVDNAYDHLGGFTAENVFKFDLENDNPFELDSEYSTRTRGDKGAEFGNAFLYGMHGSVQSVYELMASVPGGWDRFRDWMVEKVGMEPNPDNYADHLRDYFQSLAKKHDPETRGLDSPRGYQAKVVAGIAALPLTVAQFYPAVRGLKALNTFGKVGAGLAKRSLPAGIAATEFLREWDDANMYELGKATAYGYGLGKVIQIANGMQVLPRMAMLGATGFLTTGWKAPLEDRLAAGTVFALAGIASPWAEGKSITRMSADAQLRYKQLTGKMPGKEALLEKADVAKANLNKAEAMLSEHSKWQTRFDEIKKAEADGRKFKPLTREEKAKQIKDPNEVYRLRQEVLNSQEFLIAHYKALYTTKEYSPSVLGADLRGPKEIKYELINPDGTAKYRDMTSGYMDKAAVFLKPGKFIGKDYPLFKWANDTVTRYIKKAEIDANRLLYDTQYVPREHGKILRRQKEGEPFEDYIARNESALDAIGATITARRAFLTQKSYGAALTRFEILMNKEPAKAKQIADAFINVEANKMAEARANGEKLNTQNQDGTFKYRVTEAELATKYNLSSEQIRIFKEITNTLESVIDFYNAQVFKFQGVNKELKAVPKLPNYFPHIFPNKFNTWILRRTPDKEGKHEVVANIGTNSRWDGLSLERRLKNHPEFGEKNYIYNTVTKRRYPYGNADEAAIYDLLRQFDRTGREKELSIIQNELAKVRGPKFKIKRGDTWKVGFKGSELYMEGRPVTKKMAPNLAQANDFADVIKSYIQGVTSMGHKMEAESIIRDVLDNAPAMDIANSKQIKSVSMLYPNTTKAVKTWVDNAMGRAQPKDVFKIVDNIGSRWIGESGLSDLLGAANQVTLSWKLLFGNMRFIGAQAIQPYHMIFPKLVELKYQGMEEGSIAMAQIKSLRDLFFPDAEVREAIKYFKEQGLVEPAFLKEFAGTSGVLQLPKIEGTGMAANYLGNFSNLARALTLKDASAKVEQVSRLNAGIMFYNFLRSAGHNPAQSKAMARYLADQYMVEYNHLERPLIYGDKGLGTLGKPFGLFKTFQHNYLAQLVEYINVYKHTGQSAPMVAFFAQMVFSAGLFGVIGIETADALLEKLSPTLEKFTNKPIPTIKEAIATSSYPDVIKHGIPSGMSGIDFTTTLAAPGTNVTDLVSVPTLDMWGLNPFKPWNERGILPSGVNLISVIAGSRSDLETKQAIVQFLKTTAPTSLHFAIEQYYNGLPVGYDFINTDMLPFIDPDAFEAYKDGPTRDPFKKGRGIYKRDAKDWLARKMAAYTIEEREATKLMYVATRVKSDLKASLDTILTTSAHHLMRDGFIPEIYFNEAYKYGEDPKNFIEKVLNRIELQQSDFLTRALKQTDSKGHIERLKEIREIIQSKYMYRD